MGNLEIIGKRKVFAMSRFSTDCDEYLVLHPELVLLGPGNGWSRMMGYTARR